VVLASEPRRSDYPGIRDIQKAVCKHYDVTLIDMLSRRRTANIVKPRQVAMYLAKEADAAFPPADRPQVRRQRSHHRFARLPQDGASLPARCGARPRHRHPDPDHHGDSAMKPHLSEVTVTHDGVIMFLWKAGLDTLDIAKRIGLHESQVSNRLWKLRSEA
jgi:hypothetical protein